MLIENSKRYIPLKIKENDIGKNEMLSYVIPIYKQKSCMSANPCTNNLNGT